MPVGGLNPEAVFNQYRIGGKHVWLPNKDSSFHHKLYGIPGGSKFLDEKDHVVPPLREILSLIAEGDMILSLSAPERLKKDSSLSMKQRERALKRIEVGIP